jgi:glycosyltransferase involved in cell wall biosynthesis
MKISIIIPVYNSTLYLKQCVESILAQTYHNLEILLVDDGSTDDSPKICDEYATKDSRIITIHKQNGGTSDARNVGLEKASGDYITFMDNDDYWSNPEALNDIVKIIDETQPDVVMHTNMVYWQDKEKTVNPPSFDRRLVSGKKREDAVGNLIKSGMLTVTVWTKLVKTSLIREHDLYFKKGIRNEDTDWIARMLIYAERFEWYDKPFYMYRKGHETAQTSQKMKYYMVNDLKNILIEYTEYAQQHMDEKYRRVFYSYLAYPYAVWMGQAYLIEQNEQIKKDRKLMKKYDYLLSYDMNPAVHLVHLVYRILGFELTSKILMLYIKKTYYS